MPSSVSFDLESYQSVHCEALKSLAVEKNSLPWWPKGFPRMESMAMETLPVQFYSGFYDGDESVQLRYELDAGTNADLLHSCFLEVKVPPLQQSPRRLASYVWGLGYSLFERARFVVDGEVLEELTSTYLEMREELQSERPGHAFQEAVWKLDAVTVPELGSLSQQTGGCTLYVPLGFFWAKGASRCVLPIKGLLKKGAQIKIVVQLRRIEDICYELPVDTTSADVGVPLPVGKSTSLEWSDFNFRLWVGGIYLEPGSDVQRNFETKPYTAVVSTPEYFSKNDEGEPFALNGTLAKPVPFRLPSKCLMWAIADQSRLTRPIASGTTNDPYLGEVGVRTLFGEKAHHIIQIPERDFGEPTTNALIRYDNMLVPIPFTDWNSVRPGSKRVPAFTPGEFLISPIIDVTYASSQVDLVLKIYHPNGNLIGITNISLGAGQGSTTQQVTFELYDGQWTDQNNSLLEDYAVIQLFPKSQGDGTTEVATVQVASSDEDLYRKNLIMMAIADTIGRQVVRGVLLNSDFSSSITTLNVSSFGTNVAAVYALLSPVKYTVSMEATSAGQPIEFGSIETGYLPDSLGHQDGFKFTITPSTAPTSGNAGLSVSGFYDIALAGEQVGGTSGTISNTYKTTDRGVFSLTVTNVWAYGQYSSAENACDGLIKISGSGEHLDNLLAHPVASGTYNLQYDFKNNPLQINHIKVWAAQNLLSRVDKCIGAFEIFGSSDASTWTSLGSNTFSSSDYTFVGSEFKANDHRDRAASYTFNNTTSYRYYEVRVSTSADAISVVDPSANAYDVALSIAELALYERKTVNDSRSVASISTLFNKTVNTSQYFTFGTSPTETTYPSDGNPWYLVYQHDSPFILRKYVLLRGTTRWLRWIVEASNDGTNWTTVDEKYKFANFGPLIHPQTSYTASYPNPDNLTEIPITKYIREQAHQATLFTNSEAYTYYRWAFLAPSGDPNNFTPYIELAELELYIDNGTFFLDPETNNGCAYNLPTSQGIRQHRNDGLNGAPFLHMNRWDYRACTAHGVEAEPLKRFRLKLANEPRWHADLEPQGLYFRAGAQAPLHFPRTPRKGIYAYSFATDAEKDDTGFSHFGKLHNKKIEVDANKAESTLARLHLFSEGLNIFECDPQRGTARFLHKSGGD